jgi:fluoroacetyl-CoA thioesterase
MAIYIVYESYKAYIRRLKGIYTNNKHKTYKRGAAMLQTGLTHTSTITVNNSNTAKTIGSGDMDVLATPAMMALMENAAMLAVAAELPEGSTTVGGHIESSHLKPSPIGAEVSATATLEKVDGRKLSFRVTASQDGIITGEGTHLRFIVDKERFLAKL